MDNSLYLSSALYDIATIKENAIEGKMNAIEAYVQLKTLEKTIKEAIDKVQELAIDEAKYNELLGLQNVDINWVEFMEETDTTTSAKELACTAGACEI